LPFIGHWNFNHFVVVEAVSGAGYDIVDPAVGRRRVMPEEFDRAFTGVVLVAEPGDGFRRSRKAATSGSVARWIRIVRFPGMSRLLLQVLGASAILQVFALGLPLLTKILVDSVLPNRMGTLLPLLGVAISIWVAGLVVTSYLRMGLLVYLRGRFDARMMLGFFEHLLRLPLSFFLRRTSGDVLMRLTSNMVVRDLLTEQTLSVLIDGGLVLSYLVALWVIDWHFALAAAILGMLQMLLLVGSAGPMHRVQQKLLVAQAESQSYSVETLRGVSILKASGAEVNAFDRWSDLFYRQLNVALERNHLSVLVRTGLTAVQSFAPLFLLWLGAWRVIDGALSLGTMLALSALASSFLTPLRALTESGQRIQLVHAHLERLDDVLGAQLEGAGRPAKDIGRLEGQIEVRGLGFRYHSDAPRVLRGVTFTVEPGSKIAVTGPTGSGKSTLVSLLLGLAEATEGEIFYDGQPLRELDLGSLRRQLGVVLQEVFLFRGSIADNIALARPDATLKEIAEAARSAALHDEVKRMPMGYATNVAEGGAALSGGQRQRIAIARALLGRPAILILDEATSSLDVETERRVDRNLDALGITRVVVAHRLSTIENADRILVLESGRVVEEGTAEELRRIGGRFARWIEAPTPKPSDREESVDADQPR
jgi:ABC-type bacteriocin/lantibiotic exporter with double-glycine peptidase domain